MSTEDAVAADSRSQELASISPDLNALIDHAVQIVNPEDIASPAISRLLQEIRDYKTAKTDADPTMPSMYNRIHNRHNRSR